MQAGVILKIGQFQRLGRCWIQPLSKTLSLSDADILRRKDDDLRVSPYNPNVKGYHYQLEPNIYTASRHFGLHFMLAQTPSCCSGPVSFDVGPLKPSRLR